MKTVQLTIVIALTLANVCAYAQQQPPGIPGAGAHGADGTYVNDKLVFRDFMAKNGAKGGMTLVAENKSYLESIPDLVPLIQEIAEVNPGVAMALWEQLSNASLWRTNAKLPVLPYSLTTVVGPKADVQIAIRDDNDIVVSIPALKKAVDEKFVPIKPSYAFVHEALHGLIPGDGPFHHERVRAVSDYLRDNRGHYKTNEFNDFLYRAKVQLDEGTRLSVSVLGMNFANVIKAYIAHEGSDSSVCALKQVATIYSIVRQPIFEDFGESCETQDIKAILKVHAPAVAQLVDVLPQEDLYFGSVYNEQLISYTPSWRDRNNVGAMNDFLDLCKTYANPQRQNEIEQLKTKYQDQLKTEADAKAEIAVIKNNFTQGSGQDRALSATLELMVDEPARILGGGRNGYELRHLNDVDELITKTQVAIDVTLAKASRDLQSNIERCSKAVGAKYMALTKR